MKTRSPSSTSSSSAGASKVSVSGADREGLIALPDEGGRSAASQWLVPILFLVALAGTGLTDSFFPAPRPRLPLHQRLEYEAMVEQANVLDGSATRLLEYDLRLTSRVRNLLAKPYSTFLFLTLDEVSHNVIAGEGNWLFVQERVVPPALPDEDLAGLAAATLATLERRLHQLGLPMVFAPIPRKSVMHADRLPPGVNPRPELDRRILEAIAERGLVATDLLRIFSEQAVEGVYYPCDSHWSPAAQLLAAEELVRRAGALVPEPERRTVILPGDTTTPPGRLDLLGYMDVKLSETRLAELREQGLRNYSIVMREGPPTEFPPELEVSRTDGRIAISGTSFSDGAHFSRYLSHYSQQSILNGALSAANFAGPLRGLLARREAFPDLERILFEFAVHQVFFAPDADGIISLPTTVGTLLAENPPPETLPVFPPGSLELVDPFSGGEFVDVEGRTKKLVASLPAGALFHSGDGVVALSVRGEARGTRPVIELQVGDVRMRALWPEGANQLVLPLVYTRPAAEPILIHAGGGEGASVRVTRVEVVAGSTAERIKTLPFGEPVVLGDHWILRARFEGPLSTERFAAISLGPEFARLGEVTAIVVHADDPARAPLQVPVAGAGPRAVFLIHLGALSGEDLSAVEVHGVGELPDAGEGGRALLLVE